MHGFLPYSNRLHLYKFIVSKVNIDLLFHPGQASEFPVDTLISAINAYLGCIYIQAREQLSSLIKLNLENPERQSSVLSDNLIMAIDGLNRCIVDNDKLLLVDEQFRWKTEEIQHFRDRQYNLLYELQKLGIKQCIVISIKEKEGLQF